MKRVTLDPRLKFNYASWYLLGLYLCFGKSNIRYDVKPFCELQYESACDLNAGMAMIVEDENKVTKIFIDFEDVAKIFFDRYEWCDVYAMVNPTQEHINNYSKVVAIGPEFGVTIDNRIMTVVNCIIHYWQVCRYSKIPFKLYIRDYLYSIIRRRRIDQYFKHVPQKNNYIFHASTLWYNEFAWTNTNMYRGEFLKACQKAGIEIEGGLYYLGESPAVLKEMPDYTRYKEEYKDFIYQKRLSIDDYIRKTKESLLVFNTPAVCNCHGWKLAEYLCMGKAIISSPLSRELPSPLIHGKHIHFINDASEIYDAIIKIKCDDDYRHQLEKGAYEYFEKWISPEVVIRRILSR